MRPEAPRPRGQPDRALDQPPVQVMLDQPPAEPDQGARAGTKFNCGPAGHFSWNCRGS